MAVTLKQAGKNNIRGALRAYQEIRYDRVRKVQKTGETTRDMWHKTDWEKVKKEPESIQLPREDWIFAYDALKHTEEVGEEIIKRVSAEA